MNFSIRDIFLVTVIVAILLGWWVDHRRMSERIDDLEGGEWNFSMSRGNVFTPFDREGFEEAIKNKKMNNAPTLNHPPQTRLSRNP